MRVLRDIGDRIARARDEQRRAESHRRRSQAGGEDEHGDADRADHRYPRGPVSADQRAGGQSRDQGAAGKRRDSRAVDGIGQVQVRLDLGVARQQVGEDRPVGQEQRRDRDPGPAVLRRGGSDIEPSGRHGREDTHIRCAT